MKKVVSIFILLIVIYYVANIFNQRLGDGYKFEDKGYDYWQSIFNQKGEVVPIKVLEYHSNDEYIIAVRLVLKIYECYDKNVVELISSKSNYNDTINTKTLQYWMINKGENIAYVSKNKNTINNKIKLLNISLNFDDKNYKKESIMKGKKSQLNPDYQCILTNDINKSKALKNIIYLD